MHPLREEARKSLHLYMSRSGLGLPQVAERLGFSAFTLQQFSSAARYGDGEGEITARKLLEFFKVNPLPLPDLPGKLYETHATKQMDALLEEVADGAWGILYGPSGSQKSFLLECRGAEQAREPEPRIVYIRVSPSGMTPNVLLRRIAAAIGAPYAQYVEGMRQSILYTVRRRRQSVVLVLDEADTLYKWLDTLESLRELGDLARARAGRAGIGILIAGNERVWKIFEDRKSVYLEKWRARVEQLGLRVIGPSESEGATMLRGELGELGQRRVEDALEACAAQDPESKRRYINAHRLFNIIARARKRGNGKAVN
jgi:type II secretory pathway predicted ATPase ExeA